MDTLAPRFCCARDGGGSFWTERVFEPKDGRKLGSDDNAEDIKALRKEGLHLGTGLSS